MVVALFADLPEICDGPTTSEVVGRDSSGTSFVLASANNCQSDQYGRPTVGFMVICTNPIDLGDEDSREFALNTVAHEFGHILGMNAFDFPYFRDSITGEQRTKNYLEQQVLCVDGVVRSAILPDENTLKMGTNSKGVRYAEIVTPTVRQVARNQFNCQEMSGARLENQPTFDGDCFGSHWEQRFFYSEIMTAVATPTQRYLSPLTLALLEDSGWYKSVYLESEISPFGHGAGCNFIFDDCIVDGKVPEWSRDSFCIGQERGCGPGHKQVTFCNTARYDRDLPKKYQYFPDPVC